MDYNLSQSYYVDNKNDALREAYNNRLSELSATVEELCSELLSDEVIAQMRIDSTTKAFLPAHLSEIIDLHLRNEKENTISNLMMQNSYLQEERAAAIGTIRQLTDKYNILINDLDRVNDDRTYLKSKLRDLEERYSKHIDENQNKISYLESCQKELQKEVSISNQLLAARNEEFSNIRNRYSEKENSFDSTIIKLNLKIRLLETENEKYQQELNIARQYISNHQNYMQENERVYEKKLNQIVHEVQDTIESDKRESEAIVKEIYDSTMEQYRKLSESIESEKKASRHFQEEYQRMKEAFENTSAKLEAMSKERLTAQEEYQLMKDAFENTSAKLEAMLRERTTAQEEYQRVRDAFENTSAKLEAMTRERTTAQEEYQRVRDASERMSATLEEVNRDRNVLQDQLNHLGARGISNLVHTSVSSDASNNGTVSDLNQRLNALQDELKECQLELETSVTSLNTLNNRLKETEQRCTSLMEEKLLQQREIEYWKSTHERKENLLMQQLEESRKTYELQVDQLKSSQVSTHSMNAQSSEVHPNGWQSDDVIGRSARGSDKSKTKSIRFQFTKQLRLASSLAFQIASIRGGIQIIRDELMNSKVCFLRDMNAVNRMFRSSLMMLTGKDRELNRLTSTSAMPAKEVSDTFIQTEFVVVKDAQGLDVTADKYVQTELLFQLQNDSNSINFTSDMLLDSSSRIDDSDQNTIDGTAENISSSSTNTSIVWKYEKFLQSICDVLVLSSILPAGLSFNFNNFRNTSDRVARKIISKFEIYLRDHLHSFILYYRNNLGDMDKIHQELIYERNLRNSYETKLKDLNLQLKDLNNNNYDNNSNNDDNNSSPNEVNTSEEEYNSIDTRKKSSLHVQLPSTTKKFGHAVVTFATPKTVIFDSPEGKDPARTSLLKSSKSDDMIHHSSTSTPATKKSIRRRSRSTSPKDKKLHLKRESGHSSSENPQRIVSVLKATHSTEK